MACCIITLVLFAVLASPAFGQAPIYHMQPQGAAPPIGSQLFPSAPMQFPGQPMPYPVGPAFYAGGPQAYPPAAFADYQNFDPSQLNMATLAGHQFPGQGPMMPTGIDLSAYQQAAGQPMNGFSIGGLQQPQQDAFAAFDPLAAQGLVNQPQGAPTVSYASMNAHGGHLRAFARPGLNNGSGFNNSSGGFTYAHRTPSWLKSFEVGGYGNYSGVTFSAGGVFSLYEWPLGVVATRALITGTARPDSNSDIGVSLDMWLGHRVQVHGAEHFFKFGGFYDQQETLRRYGVATAGILFADRAKMPPVFDIAIGMGDGQAHISDGFREAADVDVQMRFGFLVHQHFQAGVSLNAYHWDNPVFEESIWSTGGYISLAMSESVRLNADFQATKHDVQGFLNVVWHPSAIARLRHHGPSRNVSSSAALDTYHAWLSQPVLRDIGIRTGRRNEQGPTGLVGNLRTVQCEVVFADLDPLTPGLEGDADGDGLVSTADTVEINITIIANENGAQNVSIANTQLVNQSATNLSTIASGGASAAVDIAVNGTLTIIDPEAVRIDVVGDDGVPDTTGITFEVNADGECGRFTCVGFTLGLAPPAAEDAVFLGPCF